MAKVMKPVVKPASSRKPSLRELTEQALLRQVAPTAALVNNQGDILYLHGRTGRYLEPTPGESGINNILRMAREGLRHDLTTALRKAVSGQKIMRRQGLLVKNNGDFIPVNLTVCPVEVDSTTTANSSLYLVILEEAVPSGPEEAKQTARSGITGQDPANMTDRKRIEETHQGTRSIANIDLEKKVKEQTISLQHSMAQLRRVARELTQTEQRERQRLATFIHDGMQQILVAASLRLERLSNSEQNAEKQQALQQVEKLLLQAVDATRSLTIELKPPVLNSGNLVKSLQWLADWLWNRFDFTLRFSMPEDFQAEGIPADDIAFLFDTVRELCFNIVKHAHVKEGRMALERVAKNRLLLSIKDDGVGVDLALDNLPESVDGGLGLRAIQDRMSLIGGEMHVTSAVGKGFRVEISLPYTSISVTRHQQLTKGKAKLKMSRLQADNLPREQKIRVMLVDDHVVVRDGLKMILAEETDIDVIGEAGDGEKALKLAAKLHPDVVIMDVNMPRMDGIEATKLIKQAHPEICIIALSINDDQGIANEMLAAGACAYLNKSGSADDVCAIIRACQQAKPASGILQGGEAGDDAA